MGRNARAECGVLDDFARHAIEINLLSVGPRILVHGAQIAKLSRNCPLIRFLDGFLLCLLKRPACPAGCNAIQHPGVDFGLLFTRVGVDDASTASATASSAN